MDRWLSPDPLESVTGEIAEMLPERSNLYAYAGNNPVDWIDIYGLDVRCYASPAFKIDGLSHLFFFSDVTGTGIGRKGSSGRPGEIGEGVPKGFDHEKHGLPKQPGDITTGDE